MYNALVVLKRRPLPALAPVLHCQLPPPFQGPSKHLPHECDASLGLLALQSQFVLVCECPIGVKHRNCNQPGFDIRKQEHTKEEQATEVV